MKTDNPFLMFKCLYEDIQKGYKDRLSPKDQKLLEEEFGWEDKKPTKKPTKKPKKTQPKKTQPKKTSEKKVDALPFFGKVVEDEDTLEDAYNSMVELREQIKEETGMDIFAVELKIPTAVAPDDEHGRTPYSKYTRETNLFKIKEHLNRIKKVVKEKLQKTNPAVVKALNEAIDSWISKTPELIENIELGPISQRKFKEIYGERAGRSPATIPRQTMGRRLKTPQKISLDKINTYIEKIGEFFTRSERHKRGLIRGFFTSGKIDELESINNGELDESIENLSDEKYNQLKRRFARLKRDLAQKRPEGTVIEILDAAYKEYHKIARLPKGERERMKQVFSTLPKRLPSIAELRQMAARAAESEVEVDRAVEDILAEAKYYIKEGDDWVETDKETYDKTPSRQRRAESPKFEGGGF